MHDMQKSGQISVYPPLSIVFYVKKSFFQHSIEQNVAKLQHIICNLVRKYCSLAILSKI